jgi:hypothetical protein
LLTGTKLETTGNIRQTLTQTVKIAHTVIGTTKLVIKYFFEKMASSANQRVGMNVILWCITSVHTNGTIRVQRGTQSEQLNIRRVPPFLARRLNSHKCYFEGIISLFYTTLTLYFHDN